MNKSHDDDESVNVWRDMLEDIVPMRRVKRMMPMQESPQTCRKRVKQRAQDAMYNLNIYSVNNNSIKYHSNTCNTMQDIGVFHMDAKLKKQLSKGAKSIDATLDLHGLTAESAYESFLQFIQMAVQSRYRTLLIITGKGRNGEGVLRQLLPHWLDNMTIYGWVQNYDKAAARHGGEGAYYVRLRRQDAKDEEGK